jgi:hypothetical protein
MDTNCRGTVAGPQSVLSMTRFGDGVTVQRRHAVNPLIHGSAKRGCDRGEGDAISIAGSKKKSTKHSHRHLAPGGTFLKSLSAERQ